MGDALGTTLEFTLPGQATPLEDLVGGGPFGLKPGQWTDDTSMALCLASSLIEKQGFDPLDQMRRYVLWWREGYLSSTGRCFDIGGTVSGALSRFESSGNPYAGSNDPFSAGNGSLMRLAPVPMFYSGNDANAINYAAESSRTTHQAQEAIDACKYFAGLLLGALKGVDKQTLLSPSYCPIHEFWRINPLADNIGRVAEGSFKHRNPPKIRGSGYVVQSLEAALWAFHHADTWKEGALLAANLGEDSDTTTAIYGQIAGAYFGVEAIPRPWRKKVAMRTEILIIADSLYAWESN